MDCSSRLWTYADCVGMYDVMGFSGLYDGFYCESPRSCVDCFRLREMSKYQGTLRERRGKYGVWEVKPLRNHAASPSQNNSTIGAEKMTIQFQGLFEVLNLTSIKA